MCKISASPLWLSHKCPSHLFKVRELETVYTDAPSPGLLMDRLLWTHHFTSPAQSMSGAAACVLRVDDLHWYCDLSLVVVVRTACCEYSKNKTWCWVSLKDIFVVNVVFCCKYCLWVCEFGTVYHLHRNKLFWDRIFAIKFTLCGDKDRQK